MRKVFTSFEMKLCCARKESMKIIAKFQELKRQMNQHCSRCLCLQIAQSIKNYFQATQAIEDTYLSFSTRMQQLQRQRKLLKILVLDITLVLIKNLVETRKKFLASGLKRNRDEHDSSIVCASKFMFMMLSTFNMSADSEFL